MKGEEGVILPAKKPLGVDAEERTRLDSLFQSIRREFKMYRFWADEIRLSLWLPEHIPFPPVDFSKFLDTLADWESALDSVGFDNPSLFGTLRETYLAALETLANLREIFLLGQVGDDLVRSYRICFGSIDGGTLTTGAVPAVEDALGELLDHVREILNNYDALTGFPNRALCQRFMHELAETSPPDSFGVLLFDVDHFKKVNDTYGHDVGDLVLREIASATKKMSRSKGRSPSESGKTLPGVFRYGGEEFVYPVTTSRENLWGIGERLRQAVEGHRMPHGLTITLSVGGATGGPENDVKLALSLADQALYKAKSSGRNQTCVW